MKERPILFSGSMVRALKAGLKFQTRRILKHQPSEMHWMPETDSLLMDARIEDLGDEFGCHVIFDYSMGEVEIFSSPYGGAGSRLWVRENLRRSADGFWGQYEADGEWVVSRPPAVPLRAPWNCRRDRCLSRSQERSYVPSIHMPRWASRFTLEITSVRVERLQKISEADAIAEGAKRNDAEGEEWDGSYLTQRYIDGIEGSQEDEPHGSAREWYRSLWRSINGPESWDKNPWVWVVEFNPMKP